MRLYSLAPSIALCAAATPLVAQTPNTSNTLGPKIDAVYAKYASPNGPGCVVGVYQNGRVTFAKGYGAANIELGAPITPETPFIMGSVSKQFTAASIALLAEQGKLRLDDDVRKYVPELPDYGKTITIDQLVHHTSGIRDFWTLVGAADMRYDDGYTVADVLRLAARQKHLNFDPGAEYNYSNTGYVVLGVIVQRVSGKTLRQFAQDEIFAPLGMTHTQFHDDHNEPVQGRASAYEPAPNGKWKIDIWANDIVGQGGLMTTIGDLQKWDENFYTGRVGGKAFLARQLQRGVLNDGTKLTYAYGLELLDYRGLPIVEHTGTTGGYRTAITRFAGQHTSVATMCNVSTANSAALTHAVADVVLGSAFTKPVPVAARAANAGSAQQQAATVVLTDAERDALAGRYYSEELDATYAIERAGSALVLHRPRSGSDTLRASNRDTFRAAAMTFKFAPGSSSAPSFTIDAGRARGIEFTRLAPSR